MVEMKMQLGINHIDKLDFLKAYPHAQTEAYKINTIKNSFAAAGLVPFNSDHVISKLNICLHTPTPPVSWGSDSSCDFVPITPFIEKQLHQQAASVKALYHIRS